MMKYVAEVATLLIGHVVIAEFEKFMETETLFSGHYHLIPRTLYSRKVFTICGCYYQKDDGATGYGVKLLVYPKEVL